MVAVKILIKGGTVVDPSAGTLRELDVLVEDERVIKVEAGITARGATVLDAAGMLVSPGLIDMHVHLREPGYEYKETIATGTAAAVRGGFTAVAAMPNTNPVADTRAVIEYVKKQASVAANARVYPVGAVTRGLEGNELAEMGEMREAGAVAFSNDGRPVVSAGVMRRAMQYARMFGTPIISHCEDDTLVDGGMMNEGLTASVLGLKGIPAAAEEVMVARDLLLAEAIGCALHVAHVSTAGSVRLIREAKRRGVPVTAEVTPHHFVLTEEAIAGYDTNAKVNPPLRSKADVQAVLEGLADGTIDVIASDHAPHADYEKAVEFDKAPFGLLGLETTLGLVFTYIVEPGVLSAPQALARLTVNPARVLGLAEPAINPGAMADITVIDPNHEAQVNPDRFLSKSRNTPFGGFWLRGQPVATIVAGKIFKFDQEGR
jgi:dihydroorotase